MDTATTNEIAPATQESRRIMRSAGSGLTLPYPNLAALARVAADVGMACPFGSDAEFLAAREAELIEFVEAPCHSLMRTLWANGLSPYASNAFGPGLRGVWFETSGGLKMFVALSWTRFVDQPCLSSPS